MFNSFQPNGMPHHYHLDESIPKVKVMTNRVITRDGFFFLTHTVGLPMYTRSSDPGVSSLSEKSSGH